MISFSEGDLQKIKEAAIKEKNARFQKLSTIQMEREKLQRQITELQQKDKDLSLEYDRVHGDRQEQKEIRKILRYIDPRTAELPHYQIDSFISAWINDGDTERYLAEPSNQGFTVTYGPGDNVFPEEDKQSAPVKKEYINLGPGK